MRKISPTLDNKKEVLFVFRNTGLDEILHQADGYSELPRDFLYGMPAMPSASWINVPKGPRTTLLRKVTNVVEWPFTRLARLGFPLEIYPQFGQRLNRAPIIFGINDAIGFGLLFWKKMGLLKADVWVIAQSVHERAKRHFRLRWFTRPFVCWLLSGAKEVFVLSDVAKTPMKSVFGVPAESLSRFDFGVDTDFWRPNKGPRANYVLSIGNDSNRDYQTLVQATPPHVPLKLITKLPVVRRVGSLSLESGLSYQQVKYHYQSAAAVVIPTSELDYESSGLSCALQAAACGAPLILPSIAALREIFLPEEHCYFYKPGNVVDLQEKLALILNNQAAAQRTGARARLHVEKYRSVGAGARSITKVLQKKEV